MRKNKNKDTIVRQPGRIDMNSFRFTAGDEIWTIKMREQAIRHACMEIRFVGGRMLVDNFVNGLEWNPLIFISDVLETEVIVYISEDKVRTFGILCCDDCDIDKSMQVFMMLVSRIENNAITALAEQSKEEYKGVLIGEWHPLRVISNVLKSTLEFYMGGEKDAGEGTKEEGSS